MSLLKQRYERMIDKIKLFSAPAGQRPEIAPLVPDALLAKNNQMDPCKKEDII